MKRRYPTRGFVLVSGKFLAKRVVECSFEDQDVDKDSVDQSVGLANA